MNNRIYKFRAWDKESKKFLNKDSWCGNYDDLYFEDINRILSEMNGVNNLILMQYTGLKDKQGKEIYEGDIIKYKGYINVKIVFNNGSYQIKHKDFGKEEYLYDYLNEDFKVIGNKFQNPELV